MAMPNSFLIADSLSEGLFSTGWYDKPEQKQRLLEGRATLPASSLILCEFLHGEIKVLHLRQHDAFEHGLVGDESIFGSHAFHRRI